jgi:hypothetical protein
MNIFHSAVCHLPFLPLPYGFNVILKLGAITRTDIASNKYTHNKKKDAGVPRVNI